MFGAYGWCWGLACLINGLDGLLHLVRRHISNKNALHCLLSFIKGLQKHFGGSFNILELYAFKRQG